MIRYISIITCFLFTHNVFSQNTCKAKHIADNAKANITAPYKYDSYVLTEFEYDPLKEKSETVIFTAFRGFEYKLSFFNSGFEEPVKLNIYDKPSNFNSRKKIYDSSQGIGNDYWEYNTLKPGKYYIEYIIPKTKAVKKKTGCIVMLIGFVDSDELKSPSNGKKPTPNTTK